MATVVLCDRCNCKISTGDGGYYVEYGRHGHRQVASKCDLCPKCDGLLKAFMASAGANVEAAQ